MLTVPANAEIDRIVAEVERLTKELALTNEKLAEADGLIGASITARVKAEQERAWQPIETAPKDLTILGGWWSFDEWVWTKCVYDDGAFRAFVGGLTPTHWVPLPAPPQDAK